VRIELFNPGEFVKWFDALGPLSKARMAVLLQMLESATVPAPMPHGRHLGGGLHELRSRLGERVYYSVNDDTATILACGRKDTQRRDITRARSRQ